MIKLKPRYLEDARALSRRSIHIQNAGSGIPRISLRKSLNLTRSPESKTFMRLVKSPSHVLFFASNVVVLVHLKFLGTMKKSERLDHLKSQAAELENYESVISDLDKKFEEVEKQINDMKAQKNTVSLNIRSQDSLQSAKWSKYEMIKQKIHDDQVSLAHKFVASRAAIAEKLSEPQNIASLFGSDEQVFDEIGDINTTKKKGAFSPSLTYSSPISNVMMSLSHSIITTCLVDLNLRFSLFDKHLKTRKPGSKELFRPNLFQSMKADKEKAELVQELAKLRWSPAPNSEKPLKHIDFKKRQALFQHFKESDAFACRESRRYDMYLHLSGRWRNFEDSDTSKWISGMKGPVFCSSIVKDKEYITRFENLYTSYKRNASQLKHLSFVLNIAKSLAMGGQHIPSFAIFRHLMDRFGSMGLLNYQALVYEHLPAFKDRSTTWADGTESHALASKSALHFRGLIEDDPKLMSSLLKYYQAREDKASIESLLTLLAPLQVCAFTKQSILPSFITRSSKTQQAEREATVSRRVTFYKKVIDDAICACVSVGDYKSIDKLLCKLVFNSIETENGVEVFCGANPLSEKLIFKHFPADQVIAKLFGENLMRTLVSAYIESNDLRRCKWMLSVIQTCIDETGSSKLAHIHEQLSTFLDKSRIAKEPSANPNPQTSKINYKQEDCLVNPRSELLEHNQSASATTA